MVLLSGFQGHRQGWGWRRQAPAWQAPTRIVTATPVSLEASTRLTMTSTRTATILVIFGSLTTSKSASTWNFQKLQKFRMPLNGRYTNLLKDLRRQKSLLQLYGYFIFNDSKLAFMFRLRKLLWNEKTLINKYVDP